MAENPEDRLNEIIDNAYDLKGPALEAYLDETCGGDEDLRQRVMACLEGIDAEVPTGFIDAPLPGFKLSDIKPVSYRSGHQFKAGDRVGVYEIVELLGHGGMGEVYLAERNDDQFSQRVAIKIVKAGMGTQEVLRRFQYERQILANLKHPNIAQLLYGDLTESGLPYFVMEFVEGIPITEYCDEHKLTVRERVELFKTVCDAVRYAQRNLVVHRDLKPSNILVTEEGKVKLLDFGIAKLIQEGEKNQPTATITGMQSPFTPAYAGPEQVNGQPVNAATDVYALGVILYELLTGRRPYELERGGLTPENMKLIIEHIPTVPSNVVTRRFLNEKSEVPGSLSASRAVEPVRLRKILKGDLDAIVMKALKKEASLRYPSAAELWSDVHYFLLNRPISARNDSSRYRAIKFVQRHTIAVTAIMFAVSVLITGLVMVLRSSRIAKQQATRATTTSTFLFDIFEATDPDIALGKEITAEDLAQRALTKLSDLDGLPLVQAEIQEKMAGVYLNLSKFEEADSLYNLVHQTYASVRGSHGFEVAQSLFGRGQALRNRGQLTDADSMFQLALENVPQANGEKERLFASRIQSEISLVSNEMRKYDRAEHWAREALSTLTALDVNEANAVELDLIRAVSLDRLATAQRRNPERLDEAIENYSSALRLREMHLGNMHPKVANTLVQMGYCHRDLGNNEDAKAALARAKEIYAVVYGPNSLGEATSSHALGALLLESSQPDSAVVALEKAYDIYTHHADQIGLAWSTISMMYLGAANIELEKHAAGEGMLRDAYAIFSEQGLSEKHFNFAFIYHWLGRMMLEQKEPQEARALFQASLEISENNASLRMKKISAATNELMNRL